MGRTYVVFQGRKPGIYSSWQECKTVVDGYSGSVYCRFPSSEEAEKAYAGHCKMKKTALLVCPHCQGSLELHLSKTSRNPNRLFYICSLNGSQEFFMWGDEIRLCHCARGPCSVKLMDECRFYICPFKEPCGYKRLVGSSDGSFSSPVSKTNTSGSPVDRSSSSSLADCSSSASADVSGLRNCCAALEEKLGKTVRERNDALKMCCIYKELLHDLDRVNIKNVLLD